MVWFIVAAGGALGTIARHAVNHVVHSRWPLMRFPLATLVVNVTGCLAIGLLAGFLISDRIALRWYWREFVFVGVLGGFTTFSTFGLDTVTLMRMQSPVAAASNVVVHVGAGLFAVYAGVLVGSRG